MDNLILARLQFAVTTVYHFFFVPLTLGLSVLVAVMETQYVRTGDETYKKMAKFWGKLFLINFAMGVVTGIVQEFQFGMAWSEYSRFVGDIFGVPLAIEALLAFFLESTFLGVWIFGWDKLPKKLHAVTIWLVAVGSNLSALWILIANSFMQEPVGYEIVNGRAQLVDFWALITGCLQRFVRRCGVCDDVIPERFELTSQQHAREAVILGYQHPIPHEAIINPIRMMEHEITQGRRRVVGTNPSSARCPRFLCSAVAGGLRSVHAPRSRCSECLITRDFRTSCTCG